MATPDGPPDAATDPVRGATGDGWSLGRIVLLVTAVAALVAAALTYRDYLSAPDILWTDSHHDRHGHLAAGQQIALAIRHLDLAVFVDGIERAKVWPPLHDLALGLVLAVGGIKHNLAILPGLLSWAATVLLAALLALKAPADRALGPAAAIVAAALALTSPAFRLLGADVMLDVPGAALSALALYLFGRAAERPEEAAGWRHLGLCLTLLFLEKYNYWLMCTVALGVTGLTLILPQPKGVRGLMETAFLCLRVARGALTHPAGMAAIVIFAVALGVLVNGPTTLTLFGNEVSLYPPNNLVTAAYALALLATFRALRSEPAEAKSVLPAAAGALARWHVLPLSIWMLLPDRLSTFLWFVGPTHYDPRIQAGWSGLLTGMRFYAEVFESGFFVAPWAAWAAAALFLVGLFRFRQLSPTGRAVLIFAVICALLVVIHPQRQARFLSHWLFAVFVVAGVGLSGIFALLPGRRARMAGLAVAAVAAAALCGLGATRPPTERQYTISLHPFGDAVPDIAITRAYLAKIDPDRPFGVISSMGNTSLTEWTAREACSCMARVEQPWFSIDAPADPAPLYAFLARTRVETLVIVLAPEYDRYPGREASRARAAAIRSAMRAQPRFVQSETVEVPGRAVTVSIWHRRTP